MGIVVMIVFYPVKVSPEGLQGCKYSSIRTRCLWQDIKKVKVKKPLLLSKYIHLYNAKGKNMMIIPFKGLTDYDDFTRLVVTYAGEDSPLSQLLASED
jgi:hypothetical protein